MSYGWLDVNLLYKGTGIIQDPIPLLWLQTRLETWPDVYSRLAEAFPDDIHLSVNNIVKAIEIGGTLFTTSIYNSIRPSAQSTYMRLLNPAKLRLKRQTRDATIAHNKAVDPYLKEYFSELDYINEEYPLDPRERHDREYVELLDNRARAVSRATTRLYEAREQADKIYEDRVKPYWDDFRTAEATIIIRVIHESNNEVIKRLRKR